MPSVPHRHARACRGHPRLSYLIFRKRDVDGRNKSGHDDVVSHRQEPLERDESWFAPPLNQSPFVPAEAGTQGAQNSAKELGSPLPRIGAKLTIACFDMPVVLVAREDVAGVPLLTGAAMQGSAVERSLGAGWQRVGATDAKCRGGSGGVGQAGRVLELVDERLEQKDHQEVGQHIRSGGAFVDSWWSLQADQALEPLEAELDAPSQTIEGKHV